MAQTQIGKTPLNSFDIQVLSACAKCRQNLLPTQSSLTALRAPYLAQPTLYAAHQTNKMPIRKAVGLEREVMRCLLIVLAFEYMTKLAFDF